MKDIARRPPPKKLQGVLERTMQLGKQVTGEREC